MRKSMKLIIVAILALCIGIGYASPMLMKPTNVILFPNVPEGPKADFSIDVVYANFNPATWQYTRTNYDFSGNPSIATYQAMNISYNVVLNVTNLSNKPASVYQLSFTAAQNISVKQSILGGTIYEVDNSTAAQSTPFPYWYFGGIVEGVHLNNQWVNSTWMPNVYTTDINGALAIVPFPECLYNITETFYYGGIMGGPLTPDNIRAYSADHTINGTIPELPAKANETGFWFGGVPITEYYDLNGNPLITEMYVNGAWVDVTGKVTVDNTQPLIVTSNTLLNDLLVVGPQPISNENSSAGPTTVPQWGDWSVGIAYSWFPWDWNQNGFNNTWAPHESRLIAINNTQMFLNLGTGLSNAGGLAALESGNLTLDASVSNYISNEPINGTYYNPVLTVTEVTQLQLNNTPNGYVYNAILADNQTFQPDSSGIEVTIVPRTNP